VAAVLASVVVSIAGIALLITGLARTENQADGLTTIVALALAVVGGSFFFGAAGAVALLKPFTPNGQAMIALTELSAGEATLLDVLPSVALLLVIGLVSGALGLMALRRKVFQ
jgi:ABC-2 type transport system permease protein